MMSLQEEHALHSDGIHCILCMALAVNVQLSNQPPADTASDDWLDRCRQVLSRFRPTPEVMLRTHQGIGAPVSKHMT